MRSSPYRAALRAALFQQVPCALLSVLMLDGGRTARACGVALLGFWAMAALLIARRPAGPRPGDLAALRWGFAPIFVACVLFNEWGRR